MSREPRLVSVVAPMYDEEETVDVFYERVRAALAAGLEHARGDVVAMLDGDLQDPPEVIPTMLGHWRAGSDVVFGVRDSRAGETWFKLVTARWFYRLFARITRLDLKGNSGDFRLMDRRAVDAVVSMRERNRFLRGMTV